MRTLHNTNHTLALVDAAEGPIRGPGEVKVQVHYGDPSLINWFAKRKPGEMGVK